VRDYSPVNTWTWNTATLPSDTYAFKVYMRSSGSSNEVEASEYVEYTLSSPLMPAADVTLSASPASPQLVNTSVTFTAVASGGTGSYEFKFWRKAPAAARYTMVQDYSYSNTLAWDTQGASPGTYTIMVYAKNAGSEDTVEAIKAMSMTYSVVAATPVSGVTLEPNAPSPHLIGTPVAFTAAASGGTGTVEYKFLRKAPGAAIYTIEQDYSSDGTWSWNAGPGEAGTHTIQVHARSVGSAASYEANKTLAYSVVVDAPVAKVILRSSPTGSQFVGSPVTFTAVASGGTGTYECKFLKKAPGAAAYVMVQDYSNSDHWDWDTTEEAIGTHTVLVYVRNAGSPAAYEKSMSRTMVLK
jgi:hypothetical protein